MQQQQQQQQRRTDGDGATSAVAVGALAVTAASRTGERLAAHMAWKRNFFEARPPPLPIGQLHRRQREPRPGVCALAPVFARARACVRAEAAGHVVASSTANLTQPCSGDTELTSLTAPAAFGNSNSSSSNHHTTSRCTPASRTVQGENGADDVDVADNGDDDDALSPVLRRRRAWLRQMRVECQQRCPATDVHIRTDPRRTVIAANLGRHLVEDDLRRFAEQFGRVVHVRLVRHRHTGKPRGYGFIEFGLQGEARKAVQHSRRVRLKGRLVVLDMERGRLDAAFLPRRLATAAMCDAAAARAVVSTRSADADALTRDVGGHTAGTRPASGGVQQAPCEDGDDDYDKDAAFLRSILDADA